MWLILDDISKLFTVQGELPDIKFYISTVYYLLCLDKGEKMVKHSLQQFPPHAATALYSQCCINYNIKMFIQSF